MSLFKSGSPSALSRPLSAGRGLAAEGSVRLGILTPPPPPLKGGVGGGEKDHSQLPDDERRRWLHANLPTVAEWHKGFADAFGRDQVRVTFAAEGGHVIGLRFEDGRA